MNYSFRQLLQKAETLIKIKKKTFSFYESSYPQDIPISTSERKDLQRGVFRIILKEYFKGIKLSLKDHGNISFSNFFGILKREGQTSKLNIIF